jgi:hypothetical protein
MVLVAGLASLQMCPHPGHMRISVCAAQLELDVAIERCEAFLAAELRAIGSKEASEEAATALHRVLAHDHPLVVSAAPVNLKPASARCVRSRLRAS